MDKIKAIWTCKVFSADEKKIMARLNSIEQNEWLKLSSYFHLAQYLDIPLVKINRIMWKFKKNNRIKTYNMWSYLYANINESEFFKDYHTKKDLQYKP